jgi:hypothetical protein
MSQRSLSHAPQDRQLRAALLGNAVFSATTGIAMALAPEDIARLAGLDAPALLRLLGLGLLAFAAVVLWIGTRERLRALLAVLISLADLTWVAASVAFILISPSVMPAGSTSAVLLVALAVLGFALAQLHGVRQFLRETDSQLGEWRHSLSVDVDAAPDVMWDVVADLGAISDFVPTLVRSDLIDHVAPGEGAVRACADLEGHQWQEACTVFEPRARQLRLRFRTEADDFPYPMRTMVGGWHVAPCGAGARVTVWWSVTPTMSTMPWLLVAMMGHRLDLDFPAVIARMAARAAGHPVAPVSRLRLASAPC